MPPALRRGEPLHKQLAQHLRTEIAAGVLRDGQKLPSARELADEWGVSTFTVNEAIGILADEGLVISKDRSGRIVNAPDQRQRVERRAGKHVVLVGGYAGSGKSELGRILARSTGWCMLDKDTLTRPVVESALELYGAPFYDRESKTYLEIIRPREYDALMDAMTENLQCGNSCVVTAPFIREFAAGPWLERLQARCRDLDANVSFIWVYCTPDTMHMYLRHRSAARDRTKLDHWDDYVANIDTDFRPSVVHTVIDNNPDGEPLQFQAQQFLSSLLRESDAQIPG